MFNDIGSTAATLFYQFALLKYLQLSLNNQTSTNQTRMTVINYGSNIVYHNDHTETEQKDDYAASNFDSGSRENNDKELKEDMDDNP
jgi:hypothetical protein